MEVFEQAGLNFFYRGQEYYSTGRFFLTKKQASLLDALRKVPLLDNVMAERSYSFDTRDRDLFNWTCRSLNALGKVNSDSLQIQSFRPSFYMDREEDGSIRLDMQFQYETCPSNQS